MIFPFVKGRKKEIVSKGLFISFPIDVQTKKKFPHDFALVGDRLFVSHS